MPAHSKKEKEEKHIHNWYIKNESEYYCANLYQGVDCQAVKIGLEEYQRRVEEWNDYCQKIMNTPAYLDYAKMRQVIKKKNKKLIKEIMAEIKKRQEKDDYWPKPDFPDPLNEPWIYAL